MTRAMAAGVAAICVLGLLAPPVAARDTNGIIVYQSDFGLKDGAVAAIRGVALSVDPPCDWRT